MVQERDICRVCWVNLAHFTIYKEHKQAKERMKQEVPPYLTGCLS